MTPQTSYNFSPSLFILLLGALVALGPLAWVAFRYRSAVPAARLQRLVWITLFLTFDLVVFGAFTRLTDSGLGCPDWPGCYGNASPVGAHHEIRAEQTAMPTGAVTHRKAWIEMVHRYLATGVGGLITVLTAASWWASRRKLTGVSPWWATATLVWVCVQGLFGALTVTMKLYPAIVTLHLLFGLGLLVLLAVQNQGYEPRPLGLSRTQRQTALWVVALTLAQITLGGWVSTNYAVLACSDFPTCQGQWWPPMDFEHGFAIFRELGAGKGGGYLPFAALTAIHMAHRIGALVAVAALLYLLWQLHASKHPVQRRWSAVLAVAVLWQVASGLSNVVLGWPLIAALAHTAGAAALITLLAVMLARSRQAPLAT